MSVTNQTAILSRAELKQRLGQQPRVRLAHLPTPLETCPRLSETLRGPRILVKREDCTGLAFGGNKVRTLEFILGKVLESGADSVVQGAGHQSNYCRQLAAAAVKLGLKAHVVLHKYDPSTEIQGNLLLDYLLGADVHLVDAPLGEPMEAAKQKVGEELRKAGHKPFVVDSAYGEALAAVAYANFVLELQEQVESMGVQPDFIYFAGAGGTQSGIALGVKVLGLPWQIVGITPIHWDEDIYQKLAREANGAARILNLDVTLEPHEIINYSEYVGERYGKTTSAGLEAMKLMARTEGIILDPVYTSKALSGLINHIKQEKVRSGHTVVFVHTGGTPAVFAYNQDILKVLEV
ncbi:MAG: D-cysteine desulfhydrase family protein [Nitrospira sp.]|nr:D-cysteine desulfhydrase family protein [Nitrospira sp.]